MTIGRYAMRGWVFQPWAFAGRALADSGIGPPSGPASPPVFVACQVSGSRFVAQISKHANVTFQTKADGAVAGVVK